MDPFCETVGWHSLTLCGFLTRRHDEDRYSAVQRPPVASPAGVG